MKAKEYAQLFEANVKLNVPQFGTELRPETLEKLKQVENTLLMETYDKLSKELQSLWIGRGGSDSAWLASFKEIETKYKAFVANLEEKGIKVKATFRKLYRDHDLEGYNNLNRLEYLAEKFATARGRGYIR